MTENEEEVINLLLAQVSLLKHAKVSKTETLGLFSYGSDFQTLCCRSGKRDPDGAGGADLSGAGAAATDCDGEGGDREAARGDRGHTEVRSDDFLPVVTRHCSRCLNL